MRDAVQYSPMKPTELNALPDDVTALKQLVLEQQTHWLKQQARWEKAQSEWSKQSQIYQETIQLLRHQRFGKSSEKDPGKAELFDEAEQHSEATETEALHAEGIETEEKSTDAPKKMVKAVSGSYSDFWCMGRKECGVSC